MLQLFFHEFTHDFWEISWLSAGSNNILYDAHVAVWEAEGALLNVVIKASSCDTILPFGVKTEGK